MNSAHRGSKVVRLAALGLMVVYGLVPSRARAADVMTEVPSDSLAVMKINHLQDTSTKLAALMQALGVTDFAPAMSDPLGALLNQSGLVNGLDKTGDVAVAWTNGTWGGFVQPVPVAGGGGPSPTMPPVLVLIPVTDYKAFLANATLVSTDGDISTVHFKNGGADETENSYVTNWGSFAAISPDKDVLGKKPDGLTITGAAATEMTQKDIAVYVNMVAVRVKLLPELQNGRDQAEAFLQKSMGADATDNSTAIMKSVVNQVFAVVQQVLTDAQAQTFGISIGKNGVTGTALTDFASDSFWGKTMQQVKLTDQPILAGLPAVKYLFFGGIVGNPELAGTVYDDLTGPIRKDMDTLGDQGKLVQKVIDSYKDMTTGLDRQAMGMVAPSGQMGQGGLFQMIAVSHGDAAKLKAGQLAQFQTQQDIMTSLGVPNSNMMKASVTPNAKTVDGVSFDLLQLKPVQDNSPQAMQIAQMMNIMYGAGGVSLYAGIVDPKTMLVVMDGSDDLLTTALAAAKADTDVLSATDPIKAVDAELPKSRAGAFYVPLDVIISTGVSYARQFGFPMPVQIPPNLPPIGVTVATQGSAFRVDGHVPTPLVQSLIQAGMQVYLQMQAGRGGGPGGPGGGGGL
jgi:hypothetical protein